MAAKLEAARLQDAAQEPGTANSSRREPIPAGGDQVRRKSSGAKWRPDQGRRRTAESATGAGRIGDGGGRPIGDEAGAGPIGDGAGAGGWSGADLGDEIDRRAGSTAGAGRSTRRAAESGRIRDGRGRAGRPDCRRRRAELAGGERRRRRRRAGAGDSCGDERKKS
jgi:hypothetical protein